MLAQIPPLNNLLTEFEELEKKIEEKTKKQLLTKSNFQEKKNIADMTATLNRSDEIVITHIPTLNPSDTKCIHNGSIGV